MLARRLIIGIVSLGLSILLPSYAEASGDIPALQNTEQQKETVQKFADYYLPVAKTFGCGEFAWGSFTQKHHVSIEYVPDGDNVNSWSRLMTVTLYPLPQDKDSQIAAVDTLKNGLLGAYSKGRILDEQLYTDNKGYPRLFIEYEVGEGIIKEHNTGALTVSAPNVASFIQIQSRGKPFDKADADNMKLFAQNKLPIAKPN